MRTRLIIETPKELLKALSKIHDSNKEKKVPSIKSVTIVITIKDAKLLAEPGEYTKEEIDISEVNPIEFLEEALKSKDIYLAAQDSRPLPVS